MQHESAPAIAQRLRERARIQREARQRHEQQTRERVVQTVRRHLPPGARAWLIGSLAWGGFGERSDVDIVLQGVDAHTALALERAVARQAGAEVELLELDSLTPRFRERVLEEGVALHAD